MVNVKEARTLYSVILPYFSSPAYLHTDKALKVVGEGERNGQDWTICGDIVEE